MKKILLYTDTPQRGGAELQMFLLAKFLNKADFTPILACSDFPQLDNWCAKFINEGIQVIRLKVKSKHDIQHYFQLKKIIADEKIEIIHCHIWNPASCRYAFFAAENVPIITTEHDPFQLSFIKNLFKKHILKKISKIVAVSENNAQLLREIYPDQSRKISVIHNGIDLTWWQSQLLRFTEDDSRKIKEKTFFAHQNSFIVATVAELHERKGINYLIEAIPAVVEKFPNVKFVLIGEGPNRKQFERLSQKLNLEHHVIFLGRSKEIPQLLKAANLFVLPSIREGFGLVLLEAMITGLAVIASKVGGIPEIIQDGENGILIPPKNPARLAQKIIELIENNQLREKLAKAGQKHIQTDFDARKMAAEYEKIYSVL